MRKLIGSAVLLASLVGIPAVAAAQHSDAKHEFGIDLGLAYVSPDGGDGFFVLGTPIDVRVGFVSSGKLMFEPRLTLLYTSDVSGGGGAGSGYDFDLGLNLLYGNDHKAGMYFTVGGAVELVDGGGGSESFLSINGGIGTRSGYGSGALRLEAFVNYDLENTNALTPSVLSIGARVGLSLWH